MKSSCGDDLVCGIAPQVPVVCCQQVAACPGNSLLQESECAGSAHADAYHLSACTQPNAGSTAREAAAGQTWCALRRCFVL